MAHAEGAAVPVQQWTRLAALGFGLALAVYFVSAAGLDHVLAVLAGAGVWLPALVLLEAIVIATDVAGAWILLEDAAGDVPARAWLQAAAWANACSVFLPAGKAAGEAARAAALAPSVGAPRAAGACARLQGCGLFGVSVASLIGAGVAWLHAPGARLLAALLALNAVGCALLGGGLFVLIRSERLRALAGRLLARFAPAKPARATMPARRASLQASAMAVAGRIVQALQYGIAVRAVGGLLTPASAFTAQGIHLVGATVGDLLPAQLGAMETAYAGFAPALGFRDATAAALSIALLVRGAQILLAVAGLAAAGALPGTAAR